MMGLEIGGILPPGTACHKAVSHGNRHISGNNLTRVVSIGSTGSLPALVGDVKHCLMIAMVLAAGSLPLQCATMGRLSLDDMITRSTTIVRGKVTGSWAAYTGSVIYTHYQIQV